MQTGQQDSPARALETLSIDFCRVSEARIQDTNSIRLTSPYNPNVKFHIRLSGYPNVSPAGQADVGIGLHNGAGFPLMADFTQSGSEAPIGRLDIETVHGLSISVCTLTGYSPDTKISSVSVLEILPNTSSSLSGTLRCASVA